MGIAFISLAIFAKDPEGWGVGAEIFNKHQGPNGFVESEVYHIFSYYLPRSEYDSKRRILHYMLAETLPHVKDEDNSVIVLSSLPHMIKVQELRDKAGVFAGGKTVDFKRINKVRRDTVSLSIDAVERKNSINEKL